MLIVRAIIIILLLINPLLTKAGVGKITEQTGPTEIIRNKKSNSGVVNFSLEMNDTVITANAKAILTFEDNTSVKMTEQSKLLIDDFVYDPNKGTGKLAMKVALGTARYASGQIAKTNPQSVNVKTPTATIAVRGTDFSMTVDELGRSLVILLPSCDGKSCVTGSISVSNDAGTVILDIAYQSTFVSSLSTPPNNPEVLKIDENNINNLLIIAPPPKENVDESKHHEKKTALDFNFLNKDFLAENKLDTDELKKFKELDMNRLNNDNLVNMLDLANEGMFASQEQLAIEAKLLPNFAPINQIKYYFNDDDSKITLTRTLNHIAIITVSVEQDSHISLNQDGVQVMQRVNSGGTTHINIIQK